MWQCAELHILNIPNLVSGMGALSDALRLRPRTRLVSAGSITPSSHNLHNIFEIILCGFRYDIYSKVQLFWILRLHDCTAPCA